MENRAVVCVYFNDKNLEKTHKIQSNQCYMWNTGLLGDLLPMAMDVGVQVFIKSKENLWVLGLEHRRSGKDDSRQQ